MFWPNDKIDELFPNGAGSNLEYKFDVDTTLAVTMLPADVPNVTPLALLKPTVAKVKEPLLAEAATGCVDWALEAEAVMVEPFNPKLTLLELEKIICEPVLVEPTAPKTMLP